MTPRDIQLLSFYFGTLVASYLLFIGFASFYLTGNLPSPQSAVRFLLFRLNNPSLNLHNLRDISTNFLLYMPLGFLLAFYLSCTRVISLRSWFLGLGFLISLIVEIVQAFIGRYSDITDILSNGAGYALGFCIAVVSIRYYGIKPENLLGISTGNQIDNLNTLQGLRFIYVSVAFITCLLPLDISVTISEIFAKLQTSGTDMPRLILDPFYHFAFETESVQYLFLRSLLFFPLAFLSSFIQFRKNQSDVFVPALHCLMLAVVVEFSNLFIRSGRSDILIPILGFLIGIAVASIFKRLTGRGDYWIWPAEQADQTHLYLSLGLLYGIFLLLVTLSPFNFELSLESIRTKLLMQSNFLPFKEHFSNRSLGSAIDIVREFILYAPFGVISAMFLQSIGLTPGKREFIFIAFLGASIAGGMELMQLIVAGRYVDITDCLLASAGCLSGAVLAPLFTNQEKQSAQI